MDPINYPLVGEARYSGLNDQSYDYFFELELMLNDKFGNTN